jgi:hypothetical protein
MGLEVASFVADFVPANPLGSDGKFEGDNHIRMMKQALQNTFPGFAGRFNRFQVKSSGFAPALADSHSIFQCTAAVTASPVACATLGNGWMAMFQGAGGAVTIDPNASETINGQATFVVPDGCMAFVYCDGAAMYAFLLDASATVSPAQITANQNNYAPTGLASAKHLRINSDARRNITGLTTGSEGKTLTIVNVGTFPIAFKYDDGSSTAANRFLFACTLGGGQSMEIYYDAASSRWRSKVLPEPIGTIKDFGTATLPEGYLAINQNVSRTTFASLFNEIGTSLGLGDGSTTFGLFADNALIPSGTYTHTDSGADAQVDITANTLTVPSNTDKWVTGKQVVFTLASGSITGLVTSTTYFVIRVSATVIQLATSHANATAGTAIDYTAKSSPVWTITHTFTARTLGERGGSEKTGISSNELPAVTKSVSGTVTALSVFKDSVNAGGSTLWSIATSVNLADTPLTFPIASSSISGSTAALGSGAATTTQSPYTVSNRGIRYC